MTKEFILNKEQFLNGSNFDPWFGKIKTALETRKLLKNLNIHVIASIKENIPNDVEKLKKVEKKNSKTKSLIINNITDDVYEHVKNLEYSFEVMSKLKSLYKKDKSVTLQEWMDKLQKLKANKLNEIVSTLFKIREIFKDLSGLVLFKEFITIDLAVSTVRTIRYFVLSSSLTLYFLHQCSKANFHSSYRTFG